MNLDQKLDILAPAARFDACDSFSDGGPDGKARPVFRTLMSSKCEWNCAYCPLRSGNDTPRAALTPEELAKVFLPRYERGAVQGLFLSTGVDGGPHGATGQMLDGVEHLR